MGTKWGEANGGKGTSAAALDVQRAIAAEEADAGGDDADFPSETRAERSIRNKHNWAVQSKENTDLRAYLTAARRQEDRRARVDLAAGPASAMCVGAKMMAEAGKLSEGRTGETLLGVMFTANDMGSAVLSLAATAWDRAEVYWLVPAERRRSTPEVGNNYKVPKAVRTDSFAAGSPPFNRLLALLRSEDCAGDGRLRGLASKLSSSLASLPSV